MSYSENLATENERGALFMLGRLGLPPAAVALGCHASGYGDAFAWLATIIAAADMFSLALNYRARDEFFDRLFLAGARWALSTLAVWASVVAKLTLFAGVPNASTDILPRHLAYLTSYFGPNRFTALLALSIAGTLVLAGWLGALAAETSGPGASVAASLLFAMAALGALEHLFFALPLRDGALWGWAIAARDKRAHTNAMRGL